MAIPPTTESNRALFVSLLEHHLRFTLAKPRASLSRHDWYRAAAMAVRDMLVEKMLATQARFERSNAKTALLSFARISDRAIARKQSLQSRDCRVCRDWLAENGINLQPLFDEEPDAALWAMAASAGWPHAFSIRSRRWTCPATATASTTNSGFSGRRFATAIRSNGRIAGSARSRRGWSRGPRKRA